MPKIIYAIYVNTGVVGACLDAIRLLASPSAKRYSHLTVRGPYDTPMDKRQIEELNSMVRPNSIYVVGAGNFFGDAQDQNTVFFKCEGDFLESVWDKTEYGFEPHVTVYDGPDRELAESIFKVIDRHKYRVPCGADRLEEFEIGNGSNGKLASQIKVEDLPKDLGLGKSFARDVFKMPIQQRLELIDSICRYLSSKCDPV